MIREALILLIVLLAGAATGLLTARWAADHPVLAGAVRAGAWQAWPDAGVADAMPHARLRYYLDGALPPSPVDRLELLAETDDGGAALSGECVYELHGIMPPVRTWILGLHLLAEQDRAVSKLHAEDAVFEPDGALRIRLAIRRQPGNWLRLPQEGYVRLVLQLFGISPLERERILKSAPFTIRRMRCA